MTTVKYINTQPENYTIIRRNACLGFRETYKYATVRTAEDLVKLRAYLKGQARNGYYVAQVVRSSWSSRIYIYINNTLTHNVHSYTPGHQVTSYSKVRVRGQYLPEIDVEVWRAGHSESGHRIQTEPETETETETETTPETSEDSETIPDVSDAFRDELKRVLTELIGTGMDSDATGADVRTAIMHSLVNLAYGNTLADVVSELNSELAGVPEDSEDVPPEDVPSGVSMSLDDGYIQVVAIWEAVDGSRWAEIRRNNVGPSEWWRLVRIQHVGGVWRAWTTMDFKRAMLGRVIWEAE